MMKSIKSLFMSFTVVLNYGKLKYNKVKLNKTIRIRGVFDLDLREGAKLFIGRQFSLSSGMMINPLSRNLKSMFRLDKGAEIRIGNNVGMSSVSLWSKKSIFIGDNVKLGAGVIVIDSDMHSLNYILRRTANTDSLNAICNEIIINNDVFIGVNSIITKGVEIGERSIVAAGSVVVKSIPADEIWGGNPAVFIRKIN